MAINLADDIITGNDICHMETEDLKVQQHFAFLYALNHKTTQSKRRYVRTRTLTWVANEDDFKRADVPL